MLNLDPTFYLKLAISLAEALFRSKYSVRSQAHSLTKIYDYTTTMVAKKTLNRNAMPDSKNYVQTFKNILAKEKIYIKTKMLANFEPGYFCWLLNKIRFILIYVRIVG